MQTFDKIGGYYLAYGNSFKTAIPLAFYKRLTGQPKEELVPLDEVDDFESKHEIIFAETKDPSKEFIIVRRELHQELIQRIAHEEEGPKLSLKKPE